MRSILVSNLVVLLACISLPPARASMVGIDPGVLETFKLTEFSRPCCGFTRSKLSVITGFTAIVDDKELGGHSFAWQQKKKDKVGMVYSCSAGFLDLAHIRDHADWTAQIYNQLPNWLGSGKKVPARKEVGFKTRSIHFKKVDERDLISLTEDDRATITIAIGFSLALIHEISTSFNYTASSKAIPFINVELHSAFSLEDAYSNLLGCYLGVAAARSELPFNEAMASLIKERVEFLGGQPKANTLLAFKLLKHKWWKPSLIDNMKSVRRRDFTYKGKVRPFLMPDAPFCDAKRITDEALRIPELLSNGKSVYDYFEFHGVMEKKMEKALRKRGVFLKSGVITSSDYSVTIEAIRKNFIKRLGPSIESRAL